MHCNGKYAGITNRSRDTASQNCLFARPPEAKGLELLEQSALALRIASKLDHEPSDTGDAISDVVPKSDGIENNLIQAVMG